MKCDKCNKQGKVVDIEPVTYRNVTLCDDCAKDYKVMSMWNGRGNHVSVGQASGGSASGDSVRRDATAGNVGGVN